MTTPIIDIAYDHRLLDWRLGKGHPTRPIRALIATELLREEPHLDVRVHDLRLPTSEELLLVHTPKYLRELLEDGRCAEWMGPREDLATTAALMFGGTMQLVDMILAGESRFAFAPQGAKHHAMADGSSGFCALGDFAAAAIRLADAGHRVAVCDLDVHHGDGTEALLSGRPDILTLSVHDGTIFPGTGLQHEPEIGAYNWPLERGDGDDELWRATLEACVILEEFRPTAVLIACGADGLKNDPLGSLEYTRAGLVGAASRFAEFGEVVLMGGAGGYLAYDETPRAWAAMVSAAAWVREEIMI